MKAIVLCGGYGTRLGSLTALTPKPMLPIGGEPLISHTLRHLRSQGVDRVGLNLHFMPDLIRSHVGDGSEFGLTVEYLHEPVLLGTAGTVRAFAPRLGTGDVLVVYGDLLFDEDLTELLDRHHGSDADITLLVHRRVRSNSLVEVDVSGRVRAFQERPPESATRSQGDPFVNSGIALLGEAARRRIPEGFPVDLPRDVYEPNLDLLRIFAVPVRGFRCAIDSPDRYAEADAAVRSGLYRGGRPGRPSCSSDDPDLR